MANEQEKLQQLLIKLEQLQKKQTEYSMELFEMRKEINKLKSSLKGGAQYVAPLKEVLPEMPKVDVKEQPITIKDEAPKAVEQTFVEKKLPQMAAPLGQTVSPKSSDLEKFIGENLISKIGILITIIGVAIGAKYSIEHNLISPLTRIILGYGTGIALLLVGMKLKKNYEKYSAVLVSGAMTIMYFITFAAHSFYHLIPQVLTFVLMVVFTIFTVVAALNYKQQIIAQLGLVGAYAVPFLLSDGSGKAEVLFAYVAIINIGILFVSFKKYWRSLYYSSFILSWLIFFSWFIIRYSTSAHFGIAFTFIAVTFLTFYATYLAYKLLQKKVFEIKDVALILLNSFIFFGIGYYLLAIHPIGKHYLGFFAIINALIHFVVSVVVYKQKLADKNLFYLIGGLVLVFLTIAIPIQLDGNWVTLLWAGEAALLFWIGRSKNVRIYENLSYPVMGLAFFSLIQDWSRVYGSNLIMDNLDYVPIFNINFLSSALLIISFGFIAYWMFKKEENDTVKSADVTKVMQFVVPALLLVVSFAAFALELAQYWDVKIFRVREDFAFAQDLRSFKNIWLVNYALMFLSLLSAFNLFKAKGKRLGVANVVLNIIGVFLFLVIGLYEYSELRESYIAKPGTGIYHLAIRYVSFGFAAVFVWLTSKYASNFYKGKELKHFFELFLHFIIVWVLSSELLQWLDLGSTDKNYKLGLSILWGLYSLMLIAIGIWKNKKYLRIGAMVLFGITLIKLFIYDLTHLNTISKTIVFVSLGVLLLIISFLYNKYSSIINYEKKD